MDKVEAYSLLVDELAQLKEKSYQELATSISTAPRIYNVIGKSSKNYQIEIKVCWDANPGGDIRVIGIIDDSNWWVFSPLTESFIVERIKN